MKVKLAHTADNHLRDTQYSRKHRGADFSHSFEYMIEACIRKGVAAILNSGDILDTTRPSPDSLTTIKRAHAKLIDAGIAMYVISGNHDKTKPHWVEVLTTPEKEDVGIICIDNKTVNIQGIRVRGIPYTPKDDFLKAEAEGDPADVLLWHGAITEFINFPSKKAIDLADLPTGRYKLIAMGDIHVHKSMRLEDNTLVAYPGSTELCCANEEPNKFVDIYELDPENGGTIVGLESIPLPCRRVFYESVQDEEEFAALLLRLEKAKEDYPIIHVKYRKDIDKVSTRIRTVVDADRCIVRAIPYSESFQLPNLGATANTELLAPPEFVDRFIVRGTPLFELGEALATESADADKLLNTYLENKIGRNTLTD